MNSLEGVMVIGLTGQTGAGKTTVCRVFAENGFSVINADHISRLVVEKGQPCLKEICEFFGRDILLENGALDRPKLAGMVFTDKKKLELLNSITYPYITAEILKTIRKLSAEGHKLILLDAPTLFESRADDFCELIISVISREELRAERIMKRDGISRESAQYRMDSQLKEEFFRTNSDFIIKN
ncbi:dephospho-CoA kinase, partial [Porcipelethomonas sp.]|uniref:dephospho-CoA kinase n=1 Tax=Porcipelethomonas sp. TaxID=2981675 RepID=UPI003EF1B285